jgi:hypothetical protein
MAFTIVARFSMVKQANKAVFILWHVHRFEDEEDAKLIGVYSSKTQAQVAKKRMVLLPGFAEHPRSFVIDKYEIGKDHWAEGFVTVPGK